LVIAGDCHGCRPPHHRDRFDFADVAAKRFSVCRAGPQIPHPHRAVVQLVSQRFRRSVRRILRAVEQVHGRTAKITSVWRKGLGSEMLVLCSSPTISLRGWSGCSQTPAADG
jgi:hypothetical protein